MDSIDNFATDDFAEEIRKGNIYQLHQSKSLMGAERIIDETLDKRNNTDFFTKTFMDTYRTSPHFNAIVTYFDRGEVEVGMLGMMQLCRRIDNLPEIKVGE